MGASSHHVILLRLFYDNVNERRDKKYLMRSNSDIERTGVHLVQKR